MIDDITFENTEITLEKEPITQTALIEGIGLDEYNFEKTNSFVYIEVK